MLYEVIVPSNKELTKLVLPTILGYRKIEDKQNKRIMPDKPKRPFKLTVPDKILRRMNKTEYKQATQWLRYCAREVHQQIDYDEITRQILYG